MIDAAIRTRRVLKSLLSELVDGAPAAAAFVLNPGDPGLLASLDRLSADEASRMAPHGRSSVAAHVDHLRYGVSLLNRWARGEEPFSDADYSASWRKTTVSEEQWAQLRADLRAGLVEWSEALERPDPLDEMELTGTISSVVHLAYHLGAIRQLAPSLAGPPARD